MTARYKRMAIAALAVVACGDDVEQVDGDDDSGGTDIHTSGLDEDTTSTTDDDDSTAGDSSSTGDAPPLGECGNAVLELGEDCDDGKNGDPDDGCTDACRLPRCGDGEFQPSLGEECDAGEAGDVYCSTACAAALARTWLVEYGTPEGGDDQASGVAIDGEGNVIVVGWTDALGKGALGRDIWVAKYTPAGESTWTRTFDSAVGSSNDYGNAVAVAPSGDIYVAGDIPVTDQGRDGILIAYDADGNERWTAMHQGAGGSDDATQAIAVGADAVLTAGYGYVDDGAAQGWYAALDPADGSEVWTGALVPTSDYADIVDAALGPDGEFALAGTVDDDNWVIVLEPDGSERWSLVFHAIDDGPDYARGVAFTTEGDLVVAGSSTHAYARRFDPDGAEVWSTVYAYVEAGGNDVAITTEGTIVVAGYTSSLGSSGSTPALFGIEPSGGALQWTQLVFDGGITGTALEAVAGPDGTFAVVGLHTPHVFEGSDLWVARYAPVR